MPLSYETLSGDLRIKSIDGIAYPSVSTNMSGMNFCFLPERTDNLFKLVDVDMILIGEGRLPISSRSKKTITPEGDIIW